MALIKTGYFVGVSFALCLMAVNAQAQIEASDFLDKPQMAKKSSSASPAARSTQKTSYQLASAETPPAPKLAPVADDLLKRPISKPEPKTAQPMQKPAPVQRTQPTARPVAQTPPKKSGVWALKKGSLKKNLTSWLTPLGYRLEWQLPHDFHIAHPADLKKSLFGFQGALYMVEEAYSQSHNAFRIEVYHGNKVVVVTPKTKSIQVPR